MNKKQIGIWDGGTRFTCDTDVHPSYFKTAQTLSPRKKKDLIEKLKRQIREKRGIIMGLTTPQERHATVLQKTRGDIDELVRRLREVESL